jgi:hypothetical protein
MRAAIVCVCIGVLALFVVGSEYGCQARASVGGNDKVKPGDWERAMADPWSRPLRDSGDPLETNRRANSSEACFVVVEGKRAEAIALLDAKPAVEITSDQWREFVGMSPEYEPAVEKLVLVRCAQVVPEHDELLGAVSVEWNSGSVHVVSHAIRYTFVPVEHTAVVAVLPSVPQQVFVDMYTVIY